MHTSRAYSFPSDSKRVCPTESPVPAGCLCKCNCQCAPLMASVRSLLLSAPATKRRNKSPVSPFSHRAATIELVGIL